MQRSNNIPFEFSDYALRKAFTQSAERQGFAEASRVIVATSGGGDSIALLWMCSEFLKGETFAVHINHGIRGRESDEDEEFTRKFARSLDVPFIRVRVNVPAERRKGESLEACARRLRLQHLCIQAKDLGAECVLLGHNRDDLAETVLFNLLRGTGRRGAAGIMETSEHEDVKFCRPLLGMRREFLREVLRVRGISWREDSTNNDTSYTRNYIRLKLLPMIEADINAQAVEHLADFSKEMSDMRKLDDDLADSVLGDMVISVEPLKLRRYLYTATEDDTLSLAIRELGRRLELKTLSRKRTEELMRLIRKPGPFTFQWCANTTITGKKGILTINDDTGTTKGK